MFPDPSIVRIVHDTMIAEELARHDSARRIPDQAVTIRLPAIRHATARVLVRVADRIAPAPTLEPPIGDRHQTTAGEERTASPSRDP